MHFFLDTNVIIGFCFPEIDHWGDAACLLFTNSDYEKHSSTTVWHECFGPYTEVGQPISCIPVENCAICKVLDDINKEARQIQAVILKGGNLSTIEEANTSYKRLGKIVYNKLIESEKPKDILPWLRDVKNYFFKYSCHNIDTVIEKVIFHKISSHDCPELYDKIIKGLNTIQMNIDYDDMEIIMDAHYVSQDYPDLIFVTGDWHDIVTGASIICNLTGICEIKYLQDIIS